MTGLFRYILWLRDLMYIWVKSKAYGESGIDKSKPVYYALRTNFLTDMFILDHHCHKLGLPRPGTHQDGKTGWVFLEKKSFFHRDDQKTPSKTIQDLVKHVSHTGEDIQLVPVSIFWGRHPGSEDRSLFKLLFFDDEFGGIVQRFFTFFAHGRSIVCHFGKPISLAQQVAQDHEPEELAKKIRRVLRVHFRKEREAVLGPYIYHYRQVISSVLNSRTMEQALKQDSAKDGCTLERSRSKAKGYLTEIAARQSHSVILFFEVLLSWITKKIYEQIQFHHPERIRELAADYSIVYLPCHRSHMDYLLFGYSLYRHGFLPPHTAAGVNLNFWPAGPLIRRGGGFFIRRTFSGNRLYGAVFNEYVHFLRTQSYPLCFYAEGGRSRTGFLLSPKKGLYYMILQSIQRIQSKPTAFVPVYIGYDKIIEAETYAKELDGKTKQSESFGMLLSFRKMLKQNFGKVYVNFGEPIFLEKETPELFTIPSVQAEGGFSKELTSIVDQVSLLANQRINDACIISPVGFFTTLILASGHKAIGEKTLLNVAQFLKQTLEKKPYSASMNIFSESLEKALAFAESVSDIKRFKHSKEDVIYIDEKAKASLLYYRNNVLHTMVLPSFIASFFRYRQKIKKSDLLACVKHLYIFLEEDLFLSWGKENLEKHVEEYLEIFYFNQLLSESSETISAVDFLNSGYPTLQLVGQILAPFVQKYPLYASLLKDGIEKKLWEVEVLETVKQISILRGLEFFKADVKDIQRFLRYLEKLQLCVVKDHKIYLLEGFAIFLSQMELLDGGGTQV